MDSGASEKNLPVSEAAHYRGNDARK